MSNLEVNIQPDISINQLCAARNAGYSVQRSAHIGNMQPYNMTLAAMGIPMLLVDHTITGIDRTYRPEQRLQDLEEKIIAPVGCLASRTLANDEDDYLDSVHVSALIRAMPEATIETTTSYARRNETIYRAVIEAALVEMPEIFSRTVSDNKVTKGTLSDPKTSVEQIGIMQLNDDPRVGRAIMMPNEVDIIANYIIEAMTSDADVIYHISGPDMVLYSTDTKKADELARLYAVAARSQTLANRLPSDKLTVQLVPAADARLATTEDRSFNLGVAIEAYLALANTRADYRARRAEFFKGPQRDDSAARTNLIEEEKSSLRDLQTELADSIRGCEYLFGNYREQPFISQYDATEEGGLAISPLNTSLTMSELAKMTKEIRKIMEANKNDLSTT